MFCFQTETRGDVKELTICSFSYSVEIISVKWHALINIRTLVSHVIKATLVTSVQTVPSCKLCNVLIDTIS